MSTTTVRIDDDLKARLAVAAEHAGRSAHAFILEAIERHVEQVETDTEFDRLAEQRWARLRATGQTFPWEDARVYLEARVRGDKVARPAVGDSTR
jgi:predicted transcriptional regulator